jgi:predicted nucleic acid-binding protein
MRLFLDANVIFSAAHNPKGNAAALFLLAEQGHCQLLSSRYAIEEARRNIELKYPGRLEELERLISFLSISAEASIGAVAAAGEHGLPPKDAPILAAAEQALCDLLVTGDRTHFGHLYDTAVSQTLIVTPISALGRVLDAIG